MTDKPAYDRRGDPHHSELTVSATGALADLAVLLARRSVIHHLNRTTLHFRFPDGCTVTFSVWPGDDQADYQRELDKLNWSEH